MIRLLRKKWPRPTADTASAAPFGNVRPLAPIATFSTADVREALSTTAYATALAYFASYPPRSVMSDHSRAVLYMLIRTRQPAVVAEVGTMYAGTTEVMARALWENGKGIVYTTDPLGADRCPGVIARWPSELQEVTRFHSLNSMDFFHWLDLQRITLDMVLVDGNHDYEFALFDLQMATRLLRPGGVIVMDNAEQTGPFKASRVFLRENPMWRELGKAAASYDAGQPFNPVRASIVETSFLILQAPDFIPIGAELHGWGPVRTKSPSFDGIRLELVDQSTAGVLHYQAILRAFLDDGSIPEQRTIGSLRLDVEGPASIEHRFSLPMCFAAGAQYMTEIDVAWAADTGSAPLKLKAPPSPL
jgi:predicted O-methyltransferase YrrM